MSSDTLLADLDRTFEDLRRARAAFLPKLALREVGTITSVSTGIATVSGLRGAGFEELILFHGGLSGIAFNMDEDEIGVEDKREKKNQLKWWGDEDATTKYCRTNLKRICEEFGWVFRSFSR